LNLFFPQNILVPYDGLKKSLKSLNYAEHLALKLRARLHVLNLVLEEDLETVKEETDNPSDEEARAYCRARRRRMFNKLDTLRQPGLISSTSVAFSEDLATGVIRFCKNNDVDLIVTRKAAGDDTAGEALPSALISMRGIECLVYKNPLTADDTAIQILIPLDSRRSNLACACRGIGMARAFGCRVVFYYANQHIKELTRNKCPSDVAENLKTAERWAKAQDVPFETVLEKKPFVKGILETASNRNVDLIVMRDLAEESLHGSFIAVLDPERVVVENRNMGKVARIIDMQSEHNFFYCNRTYICQDCEDCIRKE
jgi:nucleotide-binding universal stress UspA family protein